MPTAATRLGAVLEQTTTVPTPWWTRTLVWLGLPAAGAGLMLLIVAVAGQRWLPGPFALVRKLPDPIAGYALPALGAVIGLVLAALVDRESLTVRLSGAEVRLSRPGHHRVVPRADVAVAFPDRDQLVLLGRTGRVLAREPSHLSATRLRAAFAAHGIAWADQDPYLAAYRRWVPGLPDLPATAEPILVARQKALSAGDDDEVRELGEELSRLGIVVRDERKKQYWRRAEG